MSTLKVDTIQSSTGASPVTINDTLNVAGNTAVTGTLSATGAITLASGQTLYVDGGGDTYIAESAANVMDLYAGGAKSLSLTATGASFVRNLTLGPTSAAIRPTLTIDGGANAGVGAVMSFKIGGVSVGAVCTAGYVAGNTDTDMAIYCESGKSFKVYPNASATPVTTTSSTGLAVTGAINSTGTAVFGASGAPPFGTLAVKATTNKWVGIGFPAIAATGGRVIGLNDGGGTSPLELDGTTVDLLSTGVSVAKVSSTGLAVTGLLDLSASTSGQIKFPATQNASADANTLDDYEEGTWTPSDGSGAGLSFSGVGGTYTKIGRKVFAHFSVTYPATASAADSVVSGLPFAGSLVEGHGGAPVYNTSGTAITYIAAQGNATVNPRNATSGIAIANSVLSGATIRGFVSYDI